MPQLWLWIVNESDSSLRVGHMKLGLKNYQTFTPMCNIETFQIRLEYTYI